MNDFGDINASAYNADNASFYSYYYMYNDISQTHYGSIDMIDASGTVISATEVHCI